MVLVNLISDIDIINGKNPSTPSNSLVMTANVLCKYQKSNKNNRNNFSSRLFPIQSKNKTLYNSGCNDVYNNNIASIKRIPYHGNGSTR